MSNASRRSLALWSAFLGVTTMVGWAYGFSAHLGKSLPPPGAPAFLAFRAPEQVAPGFSVPVYLAVKAGESDLKEIGWSFQCCAARVLTGGAYHVHLGEEKELAGFFDLNTLSAIRHDNPFRASGLVLRVSVWAVDRAGRRSEVKSFDVTLEPGAPKTLPPPADGRSYQRNMGQITGDIRRPSPR